MKMNMKKTIGLAAMLLVLVMICTACGSSGIEGKTWKYTYDLGSYTTLSFSNGTCVVNEVNLVTGAKETSSVPYSISGNRITLDGQTSEWKITGNVLTLSADGQVITLEKQ